MEAPAWNALPPLLRKWVETAAPADELYEIRLRTDRRMQLIGPGGDRLCGAEIAAGQLMQIVSALMEHSLYAWEEELARGYFTTRQGFRVGVAGKYRMVDGELRLQNVHSVCIRLAHEVKGCSDALMPLLLRGHSCLILSPPGCGKTTLLRDASRQLSAGGKTVAVLDERSEIAAAWQGRPGMDVGERTDVIEGVDKPAGIPMIVRALSPQVLVTDEIGGETDAAAIQDAMRCGVQVIATAHAASLTAARQRNALKALLESGFDMAVELADPPGTLKAVWQRENDGWRSILSEG